LDDVEQAVHERADAVLDQVGVVVPPGDHRFQVEIGARADRDHPVREDERRHPRHRQAGALAAGW
jgi:hypothetical protein